MHFALISEIRCQLQLCPEDDSKKLHSQTDSQAKIKSQQASSQACDHPHHLQSKHPQWSYARARVHCQVEK